MDTRWHWDVFCRVIDNFGDVGVAWRLACNLAARGQAVRLWLDDATALRWMAPRPWPEGIEVLPWTRASAPTGAQSCTPVVAGDVVIETFGCDLPAAFVEAMAEKTPQPHWLNLEYLSAESYVERSHGLVSPQLSGPGRGLVKRFFFPGFTPATGGLLREPSLMQAQAAFRCEACWSRWGVRPQPGERVVSLFAYATPLLPQLLDALSRAPTLLLVCPGPAQQALEDAPSRAGLRWHSLPYLSHPGYDQLLWTCDLNFVRGEDSFVRAQWAAKPFVWQTYPQDDGAHTAKLEAFMALWLRDAPADAAAAARRLWRAWNGLGGSVEAADLAGMPSATYAARWRAELTGMPDLCSQLFRLLGLSR